MAVRSSLLKFLLISRMDFSSLDSFQEINFKRKHWLVPYLLLLVREGNTYLQMIVWKFF